MSARKLAHLVSPHIYDDFFFDFFDFSSYFSYADEMIFSSTPARHKEALLEKKVAIAIMSSDSGQ